MLPKSEFSELKEQCENNVEHLQTIINMQDNMIIVIRAHKIVEVNQSFLDFCAKTTLDEFLNEFQCLCYKFITVNDDRYLSTNTAKVEWAKYIIDNPRAEYRVLMNDSYGMEHTFRVQVKELHDRNSRNSYVATFIDITKELHEIDLLQSLSSFNEIHYLIYNKQKKKYKISKSLSAILNIPLLGNINNLQLKRHVKKVELHKVIQSLKKDSDKFELHAVINKQDKYYMVQSYQSYIENSVQSIYIIIDISMVKQVEKESKQKDVLIFQQAKLVQMGEMISMIAHQWRQPLNAISASAIKLSLTNTMQTLTPDIVKEHTQFIQNQCQKMSKVINSFMNYSNSDGNKKEFSICDSIQIVLRFVNTQYLAHNIEIKLEKDCSIDGTIFGKQDMLEQVLLNLLSNAKDALEMAEMNEAKQIIIRYTDSKTIIIEDNAGGIDDSNIRKLFMPYFTTKEQGKGTGLGLYMSKKIMQDQFKGNLEYKKYKNRSKFIVTIGGG